jgi:hypothetical protein
MTAAWMRDPNTSTSQVWQVAGNLAAYSNSETEDEGATNVTGLAVNAYRTSGFKDWWTEDGSNNGTNAGVNSMYNVVPAATGTGWTFSSSNVTKTVVLPSANSEKLVATYTLSGATNKAYVRFGLSPNLLDMMVNGQKNLANEATFDVSGHRRLNLVNNNGTDTVRAWIEAPQINDAATDTVEAIDPRSSSFTTVLRRNQAQTNQVEVQLTGAGPHIVTLGFDLGTDITSNPDSDTDGLPDAWEIENFTNLDQNGSGDFDHDGVTNLAEYIIGSDPNNASSGQPLTSIAPTSGGFVFSFPTISGRIYQPKVSPDLTTWSALGPQITGDGTTKSATDPTTGPKRFYRLTISLP